MFEANGNLCTSKSLELQIFSSFPTFINLFMIVLFGAGEEGGSNLHLTGGLIRVFLFKSTVHRYADSLFYVHVHPNLKKT